MTAIRVRNVFFMLLYAWELVPEGQALDLAFDDGPDEMNFFASILRSVVRRLLRRGLSKGYIEDEEETSSPRGRFLLSTTMSRATLRNGRAACSYTELTTDTTLNRIAKTAMRTTSQVEGLNSDIAHDLRALCMRFSDVKDVPFARAAFRGAQVSSHNREYLLLLRICEFILSRLLPGEGSGTSKFISILEDELVMSQLFEAFLRSFLRAEQKAYSVSSSHVPWDIRSDHVDHLDYLPRMRTDVTLSGEDKTIIIDAKFYKSILTSYRGDKLKLRSEHLYQLQSYMRHGRKQYGENVSGILAYASTGEGDLRLRYDLEGLSLQIVTINLDRPWRDIASDVLLLAES